MWCDVMWCDVMWCNVLWCEVLNSGEQSTHPGNHRAEGYELAAQWERDRLLQAEAFPAWVQRTPGPDPPHHSLHPRARQSRGGYTNTFYWLQSTIKSSFQHKIRVAFLILKWAFSGRSVVIGLSSIVHFHSLIEESLNSLKNIELYIQLPNIFKNLRWPLHLIGMKQQGWPI